MYCQILIILILCFPLWSQTPLSGDISNMVFEAEDNPHIVTNDITVEKGAFTTINAGCIFLFNEFCGLIVHGNLGVKGTAGSPVVFTSIKDSAYNKNQNKKKSETAILANAFDWNGIFIKPEAGKVVISHAAIHYSTFGVESKTKELTLDNVRFYNIGNYNFSIEGKNQPTAGGMPSSYHYQKPTIPDTPIVSEEAVKIEEKKPKKSKKRKRTTLSDRGKVVLAISLASTGVLSGISSGICFYVMDKAGESYRQSLNPSEQDRYLSRQNYGLAGGIAAGSICAICLPVSAIIYFKSIRGSTKHARVTFKIHSGARFGVECQVSF